MDEKRNSMKLDIEAVRLSDSENHQSKEFYKPIPEYPGKYILFIFILFDGHNVVVAYQSIFINGVVFALPFTFRTIYDLHS